MEAEGRLIGGLGAKPLGIWGPYGPIWGPWWLLSGSGTLSTSELRMGLLAAGIPQARLGKLIRLADADNSGQIESLHYSEGPLSDKFHPWVQWALASLVR